MNFCRGTILSLSVLTAIFQVNLGQPVPIQAEDGGGGGDNWTTGAISRAKLQPNHHHQPVHGSVWKIENYKSGSWSTEAVRYKISPVGDWGSTSLEWPWPWPWIRPYGIPSCITHPPLPTYQMSLRSEENFFRRSPLRFWSSSESRDTKTRTNIKNPARANLDIVL